MPEEMNRRTFGKTLLSSVGALYAGGQTQAEDIADIFRLQVTTKIPGIKHITPHFPNKDSKVLAVIEQVHWVNGIDPNEIQYVEQCQKEIAEAVIYLMQHKDVRMDHLYTEGVIEGGRKAHILDKRDLLRKRIEALLTPPVPSIIDIPDQLVRSRMFRSDYLEKRVEGISNLGRIGAAEILHFTKGLTIEPAETLEAWKNADMAQEKDDPKLIEKYIFEGRENALLDIVSKSKKDIAYVVYGADHSWINNVKEWNTKHDEKFSLVILTPPAVVELRKQKKKKKRLEIPFIRLLKKQDTGLQILQK